MSGGSYDYVCFKIQDAAENLRKTHTDPRRAAFRKLLRLVGDAMHDIEWVDSCDYAPGDEHKAIDACFAFLKADPDTIKKAQSFDSLMEHLTKWSTP